MIVQCICNEDCAGHGCKHPCTIGAIYVVVGEAGDLFESGYVLKGVQLPGSHRWLPKEHFRPWPPETTKEERRSDAEREIAPHFPAYPSKHKEPAQ